MSPLRLGREINIKELLGYDNFIIRENKDWKLNLIFQNKLTV